MGLTEQLRIVVNADTGAAVKGFDNIAKASEKADRSVKGSQSTLDKWGTGLTKAGAGMIGFGAVAVTGLAALAKRSEEANISSVKLQNSLSANPRLAGASAKSFEDLAQSIQAKTAADGDDIVAGIAVLAQGKLQAQQIRELTPLVVDLARKKGIDEVQAFTLAAKAAGGNAGALKRAGIAVDETKAKTDAYGATVDALRKSVGGYSTAEGKTFEGSLQRAKNQLGDLEEGVGAGAVDAFTSLFNVVGKVSTGLESISPGAQNLIGKFATFGSIGLIAAGAMSTLIGQAIKMRKNFSDAAQALGGFKDSIGGLGGAAAFTGFTVGATLLVTELEKLGDEADKKTLDKVTAQLNGMGSAFDSGLADKIKKWADAGREVGGVNVVYERFSDVLDRSVPAARKFIDVVDGLDSSTKKIIGSKTIEKMKQAVDDKAKSDKSGAAAQSRYSDEVQKGADAINGETDATNKAVDALKNYEDALHALIDPLFGLQDALDGNAKAQADVNAKQLEATAAQQAYTEAVKKHGPKSKEAAAASLELMSAQQALTDANRHAVRSAEDVDFAIAELRDEIKKNPAALDEAKRKLGEWQKQGLITAAQAKATGREFDGLAGSIRAVPTKKNTAYTTSGINAAKVALMSVKDQINNIPSSKTVTIRFAAFGAQAVAIAEAKLLGPGRASGGPVDSSRVFPVVEQGEPELLTSGGRSYLIPGGPGMVTPMRSSSFGGGGGSYMYAPNITMHISNPDPEAVVTAIKRHVRHNGNGQIQRIVAGTV